MKGLGRLLIMLLVVSAACLGCQTPPSGTNSPAKHVGRSEEAPRRPFACEFWGDLDTKYTGRETQSALEFLRAECHLSRQELEEAKEAYWNVLCKASALRSRQFSPIGCDGRNGGTDDQRSSIGGFALWRILQEFRLPGIQWANEIFSVADVVLHRDGPTRRLFASSGIQYTGTSLSHFATDIWSDLSDLAWTQKLRHRSALYGYLAGVGGDVQHQEDIRRWLVAQEGATDDVWNDQGSLLSTYLDSDEVERLRDYWSVDGRGDLMRARQLEDLRLFRQAIAPLSAALGSTNIGIRLRSHIALSKIGPRVALSSDDRLTVIDSGLEDAKTSNFSQNPIFQEALIERGRILDAKGEVNGALRSYDSASNVNTSRDCGSDRTHEAIYLLARRYEQTAIDRPGNKGHFLTAAREQYGRLRNWCDGLHPRGESAYFRAALMEYGQGDLDSAVALLEGLLSRVRCDSSSQEERHLCYPERGNPEDSTLYRAGLFWLARIYMEQGKERQSAQKLSALLRDTGPQKHLRFTYYGIRGMMLRSALQGRSQEKASSLVYPDPTTEAAIAGRYSSDSNAVSPCDSEEQMVIERLGALCWKLRSGAYARARSEVMEAWEAGKLIIGRNDPYYILHFMGTLGPLAIWRSARADAISETQFMRNAGQRLSFAREFAEAGDWNMAVIVQTRWGLLGAAPGHLAAAFPSGGGGKCIGGAEVSVSVADVICRAASGDRELAELVYAVMRQESAFAETALSRAGAFGFFQFMESTFESLRERERAQSIGERRREAFMVDLPRAVDLGTFWLDSLRKRHGNSVLAAMEHNAGMGAVDRWFYQAGELGPEYADDVEWLVEMAWRPQTRDFARQVLVNLAVIRASGAFKYVKEAADNPP